jgi:serine/threonine-protein kinase
LTPDGAEPIFDSVTKIGRYEVESEIGRGAMGVVYLAHDPRLNRRVAIKTYSLPEGMSRIEEREFRERFIREARAAGRLAHPGVVTVHDVDEDDDSGALFITMEHVPGTNLEKLLRESRIEPERARSIVDQVAEALHVAHAAGIVHRDVKPANILVRDPDEAVKVADFGVARLPASELTRSGAAVGSPAYMSPEQIRGREVDGRSDLFSLAAILYEMLCGERPFAGEDTSALAYSIVHETPVPISKRFAGSTAGLDSFFDRALAKDPAARFQDGAAFREGLRAAFDTKPEKDPNATHIDAKIVVEPGEGRSGLETTGASPMWSTLTRWKDRSRRARVVMALLAIGILAAWMLFGWGGKAYLHLDAKSSVPEGMFALLVDGEEVYSRELSGKDAPKGLLRKALGTAETFEALIEVSPGRHEVVARIVPEDEWKRYEDTIVVEIDARQTRKLRMRAGRAFGAPLSLKAD